MWSRLMAAMSGAYRGMISGWRNAGADAVVPTNPLTWDTYRARMGRYYLFESYYNNNVYFDRQLMAQIQRDRPDLYKHIRGVYNPVNRLVRLYVSKVYPGGLDFQRLSSGAIPIDGLDDAGQDAVKMLWSWSNWGQQKSSYVRFGSMLGDCYLKVVDDPARGQVRMEVLDPRKVYDIDTNEVGEITKMVISYERLEDDARPGTDSKTYTYTEIITPEEFVTLRNGDEYAYFQDQNGAGITRWPNEYGFVPAVPCQHMQTGSQYGENGYTATLDKINEVNDQASLLNDQVRKVISPIWAVSGVRGGDISVSADDRDKVPMITAPADATFTPLVVPLDIANTSANINALLEELERDLPELSLQRLREQTQVTAPGVYAAYGDAIGRIEEAQGNYDAALIKAQQMAIAIGGYRRYQGFEAFGLDDYRNGNLEHTIRLRPVVPDQLGKQARIQVLQSAGASLRLQMEELGFDEETIAREETLQMEQVASATRGFAESIFGSLEDDGGETSPATERDGIGSGVESPAQQPGNTAGSEDAD